MINLKIGGQSHGVATTPVRHAISASLAIPLGEMPHEYLSVLHA